MKHVFFLNLRKFITPNVNFPIIGFFTTDLFLMLIFDSLTSRWSWVFYKKAVFSSTKALKRAVNLEHFSEELIYRKVVARWLDASLTLNLLM